MTIPEFFLLISSILSAAPALAGAGHYAGCSGGFMHAPYAGIPALQDEGDQYAAVECPLLPQPAQHGRHWLPALPQLEWTQGLRTEMSRSKGYSEFSDWRISLPLYQIDMMTVAFSAQQQKLQQLHQLQQPLIISDQSYQQGQTLLLNSTTKQWGLELDTRRSGSPISSTGLEYIQQWQPLSVRLQNSNLETLIPAQFDYWQLNIKHQPLLPGLRGIWAFSLGHGQVYDDGNAALLDESALANDFISLKLLLGSVWRVRITPNLHWQNSLSAESQNFLFVSRRDDDSLRIEDINLLSYRFFSGIEWRF
ncbi:MAG: hypothetical protein CMI06_04845 [Oceanospirillaceae bacterium]|nr:hypothetical protein [Oceanospirillaceae bacterium]